MTLPCLRLLIVAAALLAGAGRAAAQSGSPEYEVKLVYLLRLCQYSAWPKTVAGDRFVIGIVGSDPFGENSRALEGKTVAGKRIQVRRFATASDYEPCDAVFVAGATSAADQQLKSLAARVGDQPVLLIAESEGACRGGATIGFVVVEDRVRFSVNRQRLSRCGLSMNVGALKLAHQVVD